MVWSVIAAVAAVVAVLAALVTIVYARLTVLDGREAHLEETTARSEALVADIRLQRLVHVSRLTDVLIAIARAAHDEATSSVVPVDTSRVPTIIPSLQAQLRAELAAFRALGAPDFPASDEVATTQYGDLEGMRGQTDRPADMRKLAERGLASLQRIAETDDRLRVPLDDRLRLAGVVIPAKKQTRRRTWVRCSRAATRRDTQ
jgi:hypothetical protein